MKVFMLIVAAMALAPRAEAADCTLPAALAFGTATGAATGTGDSEVVGCVKNAPLKDGASCNLKKAEGYTFAADVGTYKCPTGDPTDATTSMAATGCDADHFQASGTSAADLVCNKCAGKTMKAATAYGNAATTCAPGCQTDQFQESGKTVAEITCTACKDGGTKAAAVHDVSGTTACDAAATTTKSTAAAAAAAAAGVGVGAAASSAAVAVLLASFY